MFWYRTRVALQSGRWWFNNAIWFAAWVALGWPVYERGFSRGAIYTAFVVFTRAAAAYRFASPKNMQFVEHGYLERKAALYKLLKEMQYRDQLAPQDVARFQVDALALVASYVRGHRADFKGTEIFVNLLAVDGDDIVVVARDRDHRQPGARYPKEQMLAWQAISSGEAACSSDIRREAYPNAANKKYAGVLVIPIHGDGRVLGAVSIDSARPHHFDADWERLERALAPYVCLLGWTLTRGATTLLAKPAAEPADGAPS